MAIKINNLEQIADQYKQKDYLFKDLHLDFEKSYVFDTVALRKIQGNDLKVSYDEQAIFNSLRNLFNTKPGQRFLFPLYGLDLNQFLFETVSKENAQIIGEKIARSIENFEPRVTLMQCDIIAKPDDNEYDITIIVQIPSINTVNSINMSLDTKTQSFVFVNTSRNR